MRFTDLSRLSRPERHNAWLEAALSTKQTDPFCCTPAWQLSFHETFAPARRLLVKESADNVIVFAEEVFPPHRIFLTPLEQHWFFGCPLLGGQAVELLSEAVADLERIYAPLFPRIVISGIRPGGKLSRRLARALGDRFHFFLLAGGLQCAASLEGGVDGFLSRRSANHRNKLKKAVRRARERGVYFEYVAPASSPEAATTFSRMLAVELTSWKGIAECGMAEPPVSSFYALLLRRLSATGNGRVIFARHEEKDIGFICGGMAGNIYRGQQFSYDDRWKNFSIGNLMQLEKITRLCEQGAVRYDMGPLSGPRMEYKAHWTEKRIAVQTWVLQKK